MYLNSHLEKTEPWPSFYWRSRTANNEELRLLALKFEEQEVGNTVMLLAGAPGYWW